jgi:hypothetical protein
MSSWSKGSLGGGLTSARSVRGRRCYNNAFQAFVRSGRPLPIRPLCLPLGEPGYFLLLIRKNAPDKRVGLFEPGVGELTGHFSTGVKADHDKTRTD